MRRARGRNAPFVAVDCSGFAETLFESELFGHERGAFTGALARKAGLVEAAAGGTLFLDEVGDITLGLQVKLLRLLETGAFRRVGGIEPLHADFRLIAATHRDLAAAGARGALSQRSVFPHRRVSGDAPSSARASFRHRPACRVAAGPDLGRAAPDLESPRRWRACERYDFPGNIRELRNILERASLLADGEHIGCEHLPVDAQARGRVAGPTLEDAERRALDEALKAHAGSRRSLAATLGISERTLYRKLRRLNLGPMR